MLVQQYKNGGQIIWSTEDFIGLLSGYGSGNYPKVGKGASHQVSINPFRESTPGILAPGFPTTALTNAAAQVSAVIKNAAVDRLSAQPNAWLIEATKIHQIAGSAGVIGTTISVTDPFPYTIEFQAAHGAHTTMVAEDIIFFNISGTGYILYSYNDNTDGDVGRVILAPAAGGADFDDDWFST